MEVKVLLLEIAIKDAIIFYQNLYINLFPINNNENRDMWRCKYAISQLQIMCETLNDLKEMDNKQFKNLRSIFGGMNKGLEQFSSPDIDQTHNKLNATIFRSLNALIPFFVNNENYI